MRRGARDMSVTADAQLIGPGVLVLVVGASGTGKDTLLRHARETFAGNSKVVFPRRFITRPSDTAELHFPVSEAEFSRMLADNAFAMVWNAHGLRYGITCDINNDLRAGRCVVCNASRTIIADVRRKFHNVVVIEVAASRDVRETRLLGRGRETQSDIDARLDRDVTLSAKAGATVCIDNSGSLVEACERFIAALRAAMA